MRFFGWLTGRSRTITSPLVCIFHQDVNPDWLTKENRDQIPCCTDCGSQLIPEEFKRVLIAGEFNGEVGKDPGSLMTAACAGTVMLWAYLNSITKTIPLESIPTHTTFDSTEYGYWPNLNQEDFLDNVAEGVPLGNPILGDISGARPYLALVSNLLTWKVLDSGPEQVVKIWPKPSASAIHDGNFAAAIRYLEDTQKKIPKHQIWDLFRKLVSLINNAQEESSEHKLFGFRIKVESMVQPEIHKTGHFLGSPDHENLDLFDLDNPEPLEPMDESNPRRVIPRLSIVNNIFGAFESSYRTISASRAARAKNLDVIHETFFSVLVRAQNQDQAWQIIRSSLFDSFGFTIMARTGHKWRLDSRYGFDWDVYPRSAEPWYQSKITSIESLDPAEWEGTPWQSQCI